MAKHIAIIQGHPDRAGDHLCHALAEAYHKGAEEAGHEVRLITVAGLDFPILHTRTDWEKGETPPGLRAAQEVIFWADHLVIVYPLWLGTMPALLKGFFEQILRPSLNENGRDSPLDWRKLLKGRSARVIVTMGMPAFFYRWFYRAHGLKMLERNILAFVGIASVRATLIGLVDMIKGAGFGKWQHKMELLGRKAR